jgi:hypothetical protein
VTTGGVDNHERVLALRAELDHHLGRWEAGCRWFAADPRRANNEKQCHRLCDVAAGWCEALEALEALAPGDPALALAYDRLDAVAMITDAGIAREAV